MVLNRTGGECVGWGVGVGGRAAFPRSMPEMGMTILASHHGVCWKTSHEANVIVAESAAGGWGMGDGEGAGGREGEGGRGWERGWGKMSEANTELRVQKTNHSEAERNGGGAEVWPKGGGKCDRRSDMRDDTGYGIGPFGRGRNPPPI